MRYFKDSRRKALPGIMGFLSMLLVPLIVALVVQYDYLQDLERVSEERLALYERTLNSALQKHEYLPYLLAQTGIIKDLLSEGGDRIRMNSFLQSANERAESEAIYILDTDGIVIAASNWMKKTSFIGLDLSFRPYFKDAMNGAAGKFFGVGIMAGRPGFYISHPVRVNGRIVGVVATKIVLSALETLWQEGGETVFVADSNGVIVLSSRPSWKYRTLAPLSAEIRNRIHERWQFPQPKLKSLQSQSSTLLGFRETIIDKERFLKNSRSIPGMNWEITYLMNEDPLWERTLGMALTSFILVGLAILTRMFVRERSQRELSRQQALEAEKIRSMNKQLAQEIEERKRTELELREAQEELVQAGKLAALGEMATAVAHELNQPIAASKTYIASCRLMLNRGKLDELEPTLNKISDLCDRMAKVTGQLKSFVRKSSNKKTKFDLRRAVNESLTLMRHQFQVENCELQLDMPEYPIYIMGDHVRLEQVLINLFRNALDSMLHTASPVIGVEMAHENGHATILVRDNGPGIGTEIGKRLFEPFVTSKKEGVGMGLGLSISYKIIKDMGGDIRGRNRDECGAEFVLTLPVVDHDTSGAEA